MTHERKLTLPTRVGKALHGGNEYFGLRVERDLTDEDAHWKGLLLAVGAGPESFEHVPLIRALAGCNLVAEPRIWPLKLTRLVAAYGHVMPAMAAGSVFLDGARVGPLTGLHAAELLRELTELRKRGGDAALEAEVTRRLDQKFRFPGYGVPMRPFDERLALIDRVVGQQGRDQGPHWQCSRRVESLLIERRPLPRNTACAVSAALLDCGFTPRQNAWIQLQHCASAYLANAVEGAEQAPAILRALPLSAVRYAGRAHRKSPACQVRETLRR